MYVEKWIFIRSNGKVALTQDRHAKNKEMMDEFYLREASNMSLHGITIERKVVDTKEEQIAELQKRLDEHWKNTEKERKLTHTGRIFEKRMEGLN